jgi:tryprostatin B 6-hydroxylase
MDLTSAMLPAFLFPAAGVVTYILYLHRGERHLYPWRYVGAVLMLQCMTTFVIRNITTTHTITAAQQAAKLVGGYLLGIYGSLLIWRLFLNPLNKFPGHPLARLTAFHHTFQVAKDLNMFLHLQKAHQKWGDFVRVGPNTVSVSDPRAVRVALGAQAVCTKAPWYSVEHPAYSMHTERSKPAHDARRRVWSSAFSDKALRGYEQRVRRYNETLIAQMHSFSGEHEWIGQPFASTVTIY